MFEAGGLWLSRAPRSVRVGSWHRVSLCKNNPLIPRWSAQAGVELQGLRGGRGRERRGGDSYTSTRHRPVGFISETHTPSLAVSLTLCRVSFFHPSLLFLRVCRLSEPSVWFPHDKNLFFECDENLQNDLCSDPPLGIAPSLSPMSADGNITSEAAGCWDSFGPVDDVSRVRAALRCCSYVSNMLLPPFEQQRITLRE